MRSVVSALSSVNGQAYVLVGISSGVSFNRGTVSAVSCSLRFGQSINPVFPGRQLLKSARALLYGALDCIYCGRHTAVGGQSRDAEISVWAAVAARVVETWGSAPRGQPFLQG
jgi:hypothetical protein